MVPFFVVDRPISLEIIKGLNIPKGSRIGLMAHANTSSNFRQAFRRYPGKRVIKMCDSAIFHVGRSQNSYAKLFQKYQEMGADYGVMIDVFGDTEATIRSARLGLGAYNAMPRSFRLVGVAQGTTVSEYLDCYRRLKKLGYTDIAVGGLLQKRERSARYMHVGNESLLEEVLKRIRKEFDPTWLFVLGCLHPSRLAMFNELGVWGDYKGWIFEYKTRDETLEDTITKLRTNHLPHAPIRFKSSKIGARLYEAVSRRERKLAEKKKLHKSLIGAKRELRDFISEMHDALLRRDKKGAELLLPLKARALLPQREQQLIIRTLRSSGISGKRAGRILGLSSETRSLKDRLVRVEATLSRRNLELMSALGECQRTKSAGVGLRRIADGIIKVLALTEQDHRISQVRAYIESTILKEI